MIDVRRVKLGDKLRRSDGKICTVTRVNKRESPKISIRYRTEDGDLGIIRTRESANISRYFEAVA